MFSSFLCAYREIRNNLNCGWVWLYFEWDTIWPSAEEVENWLLFFLTTFECKLVLKESFMQIIHSKIRFSYGFTKLNIENPKTLQFSFLYIFLSFWIWIAVRRYLLQPSPKYKIYFRWIFRRNFIVWVF